MKTRKSLTFIFICIIGLFISGCAPDAVDSKGKPVRISDYRGKWVVINYWATWCAPCIREIPELNKLAIYYNDKVVVLGVNQDGLDNSVLNKLANDYQVHYRFLREFPIEKWGTKPTNLPVTYILNPKGHLYKKVIGPQTIENFQTIMNLPEIVYQ